MTENLYFRNKAFIFVTITSWKEGVPVLCTEAGILFLYVSYSPYKTGEKLWLLLT